MVKSGQHIAPVDFESRLHPDLPVEVVERDDLVARIGAAALAPPQRPSFHALMLIRSDTGSHTVDFAEIFGRHGRMILVRPGQVQVWDTEADLDATLALSQTAGLTTSGWFPGQASFCDLDNDGIATAEALIEALRRIQVNFDGHPTAIRLMTTLFDGLHALFDHSHNDAVVAAHHSPIYVAFRTAIEAELTHRFSIEHYARTLGYSARTITRACEEATGQTAKRILTNRMILEAQRRLVHTDVSAAAIASQLGFSEATNFTKFFIRNTTESPTSFRQRHQQYLRTE